MYDTGDNNMLEYYVSLPWFVQHCQPIAKIILGWLDMITLESCALFKVLSP